MHFSSKIRDFFCMSNPLNKSFMWLTVAAMLILHLIMWTMVSHNHQIPFAQFLSHLDSGHFNNAILNGYNQITIAFYPLYLVSVRILYLLTGESIEPQIIGAIFSTLIFLICCYLFIRQANSNRRILGLEPQTRLGWIFFIFSPASYVFHAHLTESLFLLLMLLAFLNVSRSHWKTAALFAGLSALTRNHGVPVAIVVGLWSASQGESTREKALRFTGSGLISGFIFALFPLYQFYKFGNAFAFMATHDNNWAVAHSLKEYFATFWFGNDIQNTNLGSIWRHIFVGILGLATYLLYFRNKYLSILIGLYLVLMPLQMEFVDAFRFGAVVFPALFILGDSCERFPTWLKWLLIVILVLLSQDVARNAAMLRWCY